jgi:hypothetical protein
MKRNLSLVLAGLLAPVLLHAQLPDPSTRSLGMGDAYTSLARGYEAVYWNPAMLAAVGRPGFTIELPHVNLEFGSNAYGLSDVSTYAGKYLSDADKATLLGKIDTTLTLRALLGIAPIGLSVGPFAILVGSAGQMSLGIGKDAVRLALYGNAPRAGSSSLFTAQGSNGRAWAATTVGFSFAYPLRIPLGHLSIGATYKYVIGNFLGTAGDLGSQVSFSPTFSATEAGQSVYTNYGTDCGNVNLTDTGVCGGKAGTGYGLDLGGTLQMAGRGITLSAVLVNVLGKMTWDASRLCYDRTLSQTTQSASGSVTDSVLVQQSLCDQASIAANPQAAALRDSLLGHADFARLARFGAALRRGNLTVAGDLQLRLKEGLDQQPGQLLSVGAEYRALGFLPLRVGASEDFVGATMLSAGIGLQLAGINIDVAVASIMGTTRPGARLGFGVGLIF